MKCKKSTSYFAGILLLFMLMSCTLFALTAAATAAAEDPSAYVRGRLEQILPEVQEEDDASASNGIISITLAPELTSFISKYAKTDLSWLKQVDITYDGTSSAAAGDILLNSEGILSYQVLLDTSTMTETLLFPDLSKSYLTIDLSTMMDSRSRAYLEQYATDFMRLVFTLASSCSSEKDVRNLLGKYVDIISSYMTDVTAAAEEITSEKLALSKDCTTYTVTLTEAQLASMILDLIHTFQNDAKAQAIAKDVYGLFGKLSGQLAPSYPSEMIQRKMLSSVESVEQTLSEYTEADNGNYLTYAFSVDADDCVVKRAFNLYTSEVLDISVSLLTFTESDQYDIEVSTDLEGGMAFGVYGNCSFADGKLNGTSTLNVMGMDLISTDLVDITAGFLASNGTISVRPLEALSTMGLYAMMSVTGSSNMQEIQPIIQFFTSKSYDFSWDASAESFTGTFALKDADGKAYLDITGNAYPGSDAEFLLPDENDVVYNVDNSSDMSAFSQELQKALPLLYTRLFKAGVPSQLINIEDMF